LLDFWPLKRWPPFSPALFVEKIPFFVLTVVSCVITFLAQQQGEAVASFANVPLLFRLENAPVAVMDYLLKLFVPVDLCAIYPIRSWLPAWQVALAVAILISVTALAWHWRTARPYFLMGWLWFLGTLVPVIGLVQVGGQTMADRYMYIPSIGIFIMLGLLLAEYVEKIQMPAPVVGGLAAVICLACILVTEHQLPFWHDSEALFRRAVTVTRDNDIALINLGAALDVQHRFAESLEVYRQAEKLPGEHCQLHNNLGNILDKLGQPEASLAEYREAIRLRPNDPEFHNAAGSELATLGKNDAALREFDEADRLDPQYPWAHMERAKLFFGLGRDLAASEELQRALQTAPDDYQILATAAHYLAANINPTARDGKLAVALANKANALSEGRQPIVLDVLGMALAESGDFASARIYAQNALALAQAAQLANTNQIQQRVELYQANRPWHESFRRTNTVAP
jgi:tetratricopeptide (TPR) repeat protein